MPQKHAYNEIFEITILNKLPQLLLLDFLHFQLIYIQFFFKPHSLSRYKEAIIGPALWSLTPFLTTITGLTPFEKSLNEFPPKVGIG